MPSPMIYLSIHESEKKSKPITQFLFAKRGPEAQGIRDSVRGETLSLGEVALLPDINNK